MHIVFGLLVLLAVHPVLPASGAGAAAQSTSLDEGRFTLTLRGQPAGTETFSIRRSGSGGDSRVIAQAQIRLDTPSGTLEMAPALQASGADMAVSAYQIKISGENTEEIYVTLGERRFLTKVLSESGEREREYRASPGTLLLDREVAHQFFFLGIRLEQGAETLPVIIPREGRQLQMRVRDSGEETLRIGGQELRVRHLRLEGGGEVRDVWIDARHRVIRVANPETGYLAERQEPPG